MLAVVAVVAGTALLVELQQAEEVLAVRAIQVQLSQG
jgi:hypothetical protein